MATVQRQRHAVVGLIAGSGPDADKLMTRATETGARVRFLGRRDDMPGVLAAADVLCLTSDAEAAPFAVLEAMASGLPVVATNVGSIPELVVDGETGLLVEPGAAAPVAAALIELMADPARLRKMGVAGRARQHDLFSAQVMADKYAAVITAAVKGHSR
jgi:glycosyltransferase involved in cell wall biosynthesis